MNANNIESFESTVIESTESIVIVEISSQTDELVETEMANESDEVKRETKALIEALKDGLKLRLIQQVLSHVKPI